jgi:hypothetical protein
MKYREGMPDGGRGYEWVVKTNRHPNTDGSLWGWIDARVPPTKERPYWTTREVAVWSGVDDLRRARTACLADKEPQDAPA